MTTHRLVGVRGDAQGFLQAAAVLVHAQGEVSVAFVHGCHPLLDLPGVTVTLLAETVSQLDQQLHALLSLLKNRGRQRVLHAHTQAYTQSYAVCVCESNLGCDVEVFMLLQQLLRVVDTRAGGGVCGQVKLASVMNPLQSLKHAGYTCCQIALPHRAASCSAIFISLAALVQHHSVCCVSFTCLALRSNTTYC